MSEEPSWRMKPSLGRPGTVSTLLNPHVSNPRSPGWMAREKPLPLAWKNLPLWFVCYHVDYEDIDSSKPSGSLCAQAFSFNFSPSLSTYCLTFPLFICAFYHSILKGDQLQIVKMLHDPPPPPSPPSSSVNSLCTNFNLIWQ